MINISIVHIFGITYLATNFKITYVNVLLYRWKFKNHNFERVSVEIEISGDTCIIFIWAKTNECFAHSRFPSDQIK